MAEFVLSIVVVASLAMLTVLPRVVSMGGLLAVGALCVGVGLVLGLPVALYYHLRLFRGLHRLGASTERWWVDPRPLQQALPEREQQVLTRLFWIGGAGFLLTMVGCVLLASAVLVG